MLTNAAIGGALASGYLLALMLHLNPSYPLTPSEVLPLAATIALAYGVNLAVVFYAVIVVRQILSVEVLSPGWVSVRLLSWLSTAGAVAGCALLWFNRESFLPFISEDASRRLLFAVLAVGACGVAFFTLGLMHIGRRGGRLSATVLVTAMALSVAAPIAIRGPATPPAVVAQGSAAASVIPRAAGGPGRVVIVAIDGASLDLVSLAVAAGRLPNFGRRVDGGAAVHLATLRPTQAEPVWTTIATGKLPAHHGIRSAARYPVRGAAAAVEVLPDYVFAQALARYGFLRTEPLGPAAVTARPFWAIAGDAGLRAGVVGWPITYPASAVNGYVVSDEFHHLDPARLAIEGPQAVWPPGLLPDVIAASARAVDPDPVSVIAEAGRPPAGDVDQRADPSPVQADRLHLQVVAALEATTPSDIVALRLAGHDAIGHSYLRYADPETFGDVDDVEQRRYGRVLADYYDMLDATVGRLLGSLAPGDLLIVVSGYGMEPMSPVKRLLERFVGNPDVSGTHERAPDGFLLAYGTAVQRGRPVAGRVEDVTPTLLYFLGLPIGRDMDGAARTDLFTEEFTASRPLTFIPTYGK